MGTGKRLRFEILKRDGFRCRYCGATAMNSPLEVDHVIPRSEGGTDDPENLVTACVDCNRGKSNIQLDESRLPGQEPADKLYEQADQIRAYLEAQQAVTDAKAEVGDHLADVWRNECNEDPLMTFYRRLSGLAEQYPIDWLVKAMRATGAKFSGSIGDYSTNKVRYFYGCLRNMREADPSGPGRE